ncbi:hypothetical protein ACJIZ3_006309 [Penstemon smallii]|uniref:Protein WUSCHEL n=1 Tax=Penstemon smallii TaxID=265156 RepID=A0ABD3S7D9_9LAMI
MASSNRHWPSMFKSKPQWQKDIINPSLVSSGNANFQRTQVGSTEERTPEPKPRWNPRPEQIRILESIFNSGLVNPPREEIRKIRARLQEYGQVGDANVFYWFQNRKSRSKHKQRNTKSSSSKTQQINTTTPPIISSSSSSSDKSPPKNSCTVSVGNSSTLMDLLNSPTSSVNQPLPFFNNNNNNSSDELFMEPYFFPVQQNTGGSTSSGFCFPDHDEDFLLSELMLMSKKDGDEKMKMQQQPNTIVPPSFPFPNPTPQIIQGEPCTNNKSTVFINDVCLEVGVGPFNVREAFGEDAVLIQAITGQPVLTNEWGLTIQSLQHGAFYYLVRASTPDHTPTLICLI